MAHLAGEVKDDDTEGKRPLAYDNGRAFACRQTIAVLQTKGLFAHPWHSWEQRLNENTNGLIRQYLPKQTDFSKRISLK